MRNKTLVVDIDIEAMCTVELKSPMLVIAREQVWNRQSYHCGTCLVNSTYLLLRNVEHLVGHISDAAISINSIYPSTRATSRESIVSIIGNIGRRCG